MPTREPGCSCRPAEIATDLGQIVHLYRCERWSTYRIAALTGDSRAAIAAALRGAGVPLRPRGAGGVRPDRRVQDPADLEHLLRAWYAEARMSSAQIADKLAIPERLVRARLAEFGIARRTRGPHNREDRRTIEPGIIEHWYTDVQLSADEIAELTQTSRGVVLRNAHDYGVPVRVGGPPSRAGPAAIALIDTLYADPLVTAVLAAHAVPVRPAGGPLFERFAVPVPLTPELVTQLYLDAGVSSTHIELLTGNPAITVKRALNTAGVAMRGPGGRCPFLRRARAAAATSPRQRR